MIKFYGTLKKITLTALVDYMVRNLVYEKEDGIV